MANDFQTIESGSGILKNAYVGSDDSSDALRAALKRKRLKLTADKFGLDAEIKEEVAQELQ